ncbi:MAG: ribose-phosphate pyrophosphokinase [archaeon]
MHNNSLMVFCGNANRPLAENICSYMGISLGEALVGKFADCEVNLKILDSVRGKDVFVIQPTGPPANQNLMELLIFCDALKRASAERITAVVPYYGYARQDRKIQSRDPISAKLVANLIQTAGANRVLAMDLHVGQIQGFFDIPCDNLTAALIITQYFRNQDHKDLVVVAPDLGEIKRVRSLALAFDAPIAIIDKRRPKENESEVMGVIGEVEGKTAIIFDDIIDTAGTVVKATEALLERGAKEVRVGCTHALLSGPAIERIRNSELKELVVTDTIQLPQEKLIEKIKVISVAPLLGEAIKRIHAGESVSSLFRQVVGNRQTYLNT